MHLPISFFAFCEDGEKMMNARGAACDLSSIARGKRRDRSPPKARATPREVTA